MQYLDFEIAHYVSEKIKIFSKSRNVHIYYNDKKVIISFPFKLWDFFNFSRTFRRFLRTDKCNVFLISDYPLQLVLIRQGEVFHYNQNNGLKRTLKLKNCRNLMHVDICKSKNGCLFFGEYGANNDRIEVPIYKSSDKGVSWDVVYEFPKNSIKHIHCIKEDPFTNKLWTFTGDNDGECKILISDINFDDREILGDGSQKWRACDVFFLKNEVVWLMDSPNEISYSVHLNRITKKIRLGAKFNGPVWYKTKVNDFFLCASSVEPGYSVEYGYSDLLISKDLLNWKIIKSYKKDNYNIDLFKYGVISFPQGINTINNFYIFGEALKNIDGKVITLNLEHEY
tara:strand:+ start:2304 stop:3323 length:1020 start_codon:yes stop_codon:yes gene_type:complete